VLRYTGSRLLSGLATVVVSSLIVFYLIRLIPGDPISAQLGDNFDPQAAKALRDLYGLNEPVYAQYFSWIGGIFTGDLGFSLTNQSPVGPEVAARIPRTLLLLVGGVLVGVLLAVPAAVIAAVWRGRWPDTAFGVGTVMLLSCPQFFLGLLLIAGVSVKLGWLPASGFVDFGEDPLGSLRALILPGLTIGLGMAAFVTRTLRSSMLDVLGQNYLRTARAHGVPERAVILIHALRNAAIPAITVVGLEVGYLLGGSIVVEQVFSYPGMGQLIIDSITRRDYPFIQIALLFFTTGFVIVNVLVDLTYGALDPRVRLRNP
jgi:peptide/nickel transport system permease protein